MADEITVTKNRGRDPPLPDHCTPPWPAGNDSQSSLDNSNDASGDVHPASLQSLPTLFGDGSRVYPANDDIKGFLKSDLDLHRLEQIYGQLWMAGRPLRGRALHRYKMLGFDVYRTQQMDLHLLKYQNRIMMKPLPEWIFDSGFWEKYICDDIELHKSASGFLLSYVWLITTPLDLKFAHEYSLVPLSITWPWWKNFVKVFYEKIDCNALDQVNKRYHFGELRLGRVNSIYRTRFMFTHFVRGYLYGYNRYGVFFQRYSWLLTVFLFVSIALSAMQVGVSVYPLSESGAFMQASYGFVVLSLVAVAVVLLLGLVLYCFIFFFNMVAAINHAKRNISMRNKWAEERKEK
ncbi:hypothetical protein BU24DRAFT_432974 [Aaosphaeria arxii CBS 175.79]|uniref:Uncharacterized protein n=1 Tax=Aaosphaeria arxii CBS 175.79 TaxID=1450172 RepID=A0A6A5XT28_9PLEO|nr:uncharacterized protein BU24DRAFT_432974 [Aaosphaeria arxii CBS 175.79]KAF2015404.1 hypothetical protein BU24DRAFT_432974 [Aaosphaeria arxii CBS 175.79]